MGELLLTGATAPGQTAEPVNSSRGVSRGSSSLNQEEGSLRKAPLSRDIHHVQLQSPPLPFRVQADVT